MSVRPCPLCQHPSPRWLEKASAEVSVNYYRCEACACVFAIDKRDATGSANIVSPSQPQTRWDS